jgi:hypothetical protein
MKKILLSAVALLTTMTVNAQEVGQILTEDLVSRIGLTTDKNDEGKSIKNDVAAGTVFCETENVTMSAAFDDSYSPENAASPKIDDANYGTIKIGDLTIDATQATQGNSNPKDEAGSNPAAASTVPVGPAAVFQFDVKKDGYLYVFHKATSNKNYMVYENKAPMGYIFTMSTDGTKALPKVFGYELKGEGEYNYLPDGTEVKMPEKILLGDDAEDVKQNGLSVIKFPVFAGCSYWVNATGSKITSCGFYFDETGDATITIENGVSEALILLDKGQIPGAAPAPVEEKVYSVIGTLVGGWDVENDVDMTVVNGVYSATIDNIAAGSYEWKIRQDHAWTINWGDAGDGTGVQDGPNFIAELPEGASITITFNPATAEIHTYVVGGAIEPEPVGPAIVGEIDWTQQEAFNNWCSGENGSTAVVGAEGLEINVPSAGDNYWNPQTVVLNIEGEKVADNPDAPAILAEDGQYQVVIVAKHPAGHLQVNLGTWDDGVSLQKDFDVEEAADFHEIVVDFSEGWPADCFSNVHVLWQSGALPGLSVLKSIQIIDLNATAIKTVKAGKKFEGAIYNLAGQKVNASYKGVVIKDGKKYIQK